MKSKETGFDMLAMALRGVDPEWRPYPLRYISLHTSDPGHSSDQDAEEVTFAGYSRIRVLPSLWKRAAIGYTNGDVLLGSVCGEDCDDVVTHVAVGIAPDGPGQILYAGRLKSPVQLAFNRRVAFEAGALTFIET